MDNNTNPKKHKKANTNGFYVILSLCLIAVGIAAWSAFSAVSEYKAEPEQQLENNNINITEPKAEEPVTGELPNIEYTEVPTNKSETEIAEPVKPIADYFVMPVAGNIIKSFDNITLQYSATLNDMRLHEGIDIAADVGSPVKSAGDGTVTEIYKDSSYGYTVVIDHGNDTVAKYCGLAENISVQSGGTVNAGTEIGTVGEIPIESADVSHFHFEMFKSGKAVSPTKAMGFEE